MAQADNSRKDNRWSLQGMTALVTGGTKGIGHAIIEELAGLRARIHTCSRTETDLNKCLLDWAAKGFQVTGSVCDVSSQAQREKLINTINNVGTAILKPTPDITTEDFSFMMGTNFESAYNLSTCLSSFESFRGRKHCFSLFDCWCGIRAMNHLAKYLACEWAKDNIRVNSVAPWFIRTPLTEDRISSLELQWDALESQRKCHPWWDSCVYQHPLI
ncbi:Short-chain dehydrogenase/reductase SDR - like 10 [Theobroma cacao]|nr:Short-chain dehydrogenase/reductase SDR - like 10 [Theobroma cacao]